MNNNYNGIINIYKEKGYTSFDVVAKLRGILKMRKIGHTGTLDPDATGVLPVVLGNATKLVDMLTDKKKEYIAGFELGKRTDTQDIWGRLISESKVNTTIKELKATINSFLGDSLQLPPMYSAIKVDGKKLYELAREGKEVERKKRPITIYEIEILNIELPFVEIRVLCSKGTYIRTLCHDIGDKLGCGAVMTSLKRTRSGDFSLSNALSLNEVEEIMKSGKIEDYIIPVDALFLDYSKLKPSGELLRLSKNGNKLKKREIEKFIIEEKNSDKLRLYDENDEFFALYEYDRESRLYKVDKMFI